jgi:hypothetical protein
MPATTSGLWSPNDVYRRIASGTWNASDDFAAGDGIVLMKPTSIVATGAGSSATISQTGSVTFASCATLSLNGVFNTDYDNYMMVMRMTSASSDTNINLRLRVGGTDNSTASSYTRQALAADGTSVTGIRASSDSATPFTAAFTTQREGSSAFFYGPFLAQPTAMRQVSALAFGSAYIYDTAHTHNQSTSYDGFTLLGQTSAFTGLISIYGLEGT